MILESVNYKKKQKLIVPSVDFKKNEILLKSV